MKPHPLTDPEVAALVARLRSDLANLTDLAIEARRHNAALGEWLLDATALLATHPDTEGVAELLAEIGRGL